MSMSTRQAVDFDPLALMVMSNAVSMIAEEMGAVLERGALSPNIRERRDASSALFDARGRMIAQAAHIPVHLGAMPESVRAVMTHLPEEGDVFLLNDPYAGGSHLPDLTMVEAIGDSGSVVGFAAVRAHHADVGGMSPGSMPQGATELFQEGLIVPPVRIARRGTTVDDVLRLVLANVRTPGSDTATSPRSAPPVRRVATAGLHCARVKRTRASTRPAMRCSSTHAAVPSRASPSWATFAARRSMPSKATACRMPTSRSPWTCRFATAGSASTFPARHPPFVET